MSEEENTPQEKPEVFAVKKGKQGWQFSRRGFLAATAATAILAAGCNPSSDIVESTPTQTPTETPTPEPTVDPAIVMENCLSVQAHNGVIGYLAISADGSFMVTVTAAQDNTIKLWSLPDAQLLATKTLEQITFPIALSPDGTEIALQNIDKDIEIYSLPDFSLSHTLLNPFDDVYIYHMTYSPDGKLLATGCSDGKVRIWSRPDLELFQTVEGHTAGVSYVAFSPDGSQLASGSIDNNIAIWPVINGQLGQLVQMLENHTDYIDRLVFSPDGTRMASHSGDEMIYIWSIPDWKISVNQNGKSGMAFSQDGSVLVFGRNSNEVIFWSVEDDVQANSIYGHEAIVNQVAITPDGKLLVTGDMNGQIKLWSFPEGDIIGCAMDLAASPDTAEGITYEATTESGETVTYTLPCGSALPAGAVCVCNCVAGAGCSCVGYTACSCDSYSPCSCDSYTSGGGSHYWYPD